MLFNDISLINLIDLNLNNKTDCIFTEKYKALRQYNALILLSILFHSHPINHYYIFPGTRSNINPSFLDEIDLKHLILK